MRLARLKIRSEGNWISEFSNQTGLSVKVRRCMHKSGGKGRSLLSIEGSKPVTAEEMRDNIDSLRTGCSLTLSAVSPGRWVGTAEVTDCRLCCALSNSNCILDSAKSREDGSVEWHVVAPDSRSLKALIAELRLQKCEVDVESVKQLKDSLELTEHQQRTLKLAYELGYFDIPKRINLEKLSKRLEISKPTLDIILRRAQRKLVEDHMLES